MRRRRPRRSTALSACRSARWSSASGSFIRRRHRGPTPPEPSETDSQALIPGYLSHQPPVSFDLPKPSTLCARRGQEGRRCHAIVGSVTESAVPITVASPAESVFLTLTPAQMSRSAVHGKPSPAAGFAVGDARSGSTERWRLPSERARGAIASIYRLLAE